MALGEFLTVSSEQSRNVPQFIDFMMNELRNAQGAQIEQERGFVNTKSIVKSLVGKQGQLFDKVRSQLKKLHQTSENFDNNKMEDYFRSISKEIVNFGDFEVQLSTEQENACIEKWSVELDTLYNKLEGLANSDETKMKITEGGLIDKNTVALLTEKVPKFSGSPYSSPANFGSGNQAKVGSGEIFKKSNTTEDGLNAQALKVWARVQTKLEELDGMNSVDLLIKEATDKANLSRLYEGWTSWV